MTWTETTPENDVNRWWRSDDGRFRIVLTTGGPWHTLIDGPTPVRTFRCLEDAERHAATLVENRPCPVSPPDRN